MYLCVYIDIDVYTYIDVYPVTPYFVSSTTQYVPVHVLPKLEYQLSYGVECLSSSEACQLWTEEALHSSTVSYTGHY